MASVSSPNGADPGGESHVLNVDATWPERAHVPLSKADEERARVRLGQILARSVALSGLIDKQAADELGVDRAQFSRWINGKENPQMWRFQAHDLLGPALLQAQAEATPGATVRLVIELERKVQ